MSDGDPMGWLDMRCEQPPSDLTAKLAAMRERHIKDNHKKGTIPYCDEVIAFQALEAVLAMPEKEPCVIEGCENKYEAGETSGYNQALAEVRATIEGKVGKE